MIEPGRELDALVAEKVMGWTRGTISTYGGLMPAWIDATGRAHPPNATSGGWLPSVDIRAAWEVVEKMQADGWMWQVEYDYEELMAGFYRGRDAEGDLDSHFVVSTTAPLAICLAALEAKGATKGAT